VFFGDYLNITAHNNVIRPMWMQLNSTSLSVWTALVDGTLLGLPETNNLQAPMPMNAAPNPFNSSTIISFVLKRPEVLSLTITDLNGRVVARPFTNEPMSAGDHDYVLSAAEAALPAGIYFCTLSGKNTNQTQKLICY
jgi:hypothetical protein